MRSLLACTLAVLAVISGVVAPNTRPQQQSCVCKYDGYGGGGYGSGGAFGHGKRSILEARLNMQEARITRIDDFLKQVSDAMKTGAEKRSDIILSHRDIGRRVRGLEGHACPEGQFFCGKNDRACIGNLLVCDGNPDCLESGLDEDENTCYNPAQSGFTFKGEINGVDLCTKRKPKAFTFIMTSVRRLTYFSARLWITANVVVHLRSEDGQVEQTDTLQVSGYYYPAEKTLFFYPPEDDRLAFICVFEDTQEDHCHGSIIHEQSKTPCLDFTMFKQ